MGIKDWQVCPSYAGKRLYVDFTKNMFGDIKIMSDKKIIKGEDIGEKPGSEWERLIPYDPGYKFTDKDIISFRRLPEKSELEKWADEYFTHKEAKFGAMKGAEKMIEVAEKAIKEYEKLRGYPFSNYITTDALKRFAGVK